MNKKQEFRERSMYIYIICILKVGIDSAENFTSTYVYGNFFSVKAGPASILAYTRNAKNNTIKSSFYIGVFSGFLIF